MMPLLSLSIIGARALPSEYNAYAYTPDNMQEVLDQGSCGSCWAFSVTQQLSARIVTFQPNTTLGKFGGVISPEIPVALFGIGGCGGADPKAAVEHIQGKGLPEISCAAYQQATHDCASSESGSDHGCTYISPDTCYSAPGRDYHTWGYYRQAYVNGVQSISGFTEMRNDVYTWGPLSVMISVTQEFMGYHRGISSFADSVLPGKHEVLIVGWGSADSSVRKADTYWRVKNTWTSSWGENGFFRIWAGYNCLSIEEAGTSIRFGRDDTEFASLRSHTPRTARNVHSVVPGGWVDVDLDIHWDLVKEASKALELQEGATPHIKRVEAQVVAGYNMKLLAGLGGKAVTALAHMPLENDRITGSRFKNGPRFKIIDVHELGDVVV